MDNTQNQPKKQEKTPKTTQINITKGQLATLLSKLLTFRAPKVREEQYSTDSECAASILWTASMLGDTTGKTVADIGAGPGMLGLGTMLLGARKVFFVEKDKEALELAEQNHKNLKDALKSESFDEIPASFQNKDVRDFTEHTDVVIQNPPFGTRKEHEDTVFLEKSFETAPVVYSLHKTSTDAHIHKLASTHGFIVTHTWQIQHPLRQTHSFHKSKRKDIRVTWYRFERAKHTNPHTKQDPDKKQN